MRSLMIQLILIAGIALFIMVGGIVFHETLYAFVGTLYYFAVFDVIGFYYLAEKQPDKVKLYRIIQIGQMILFAALLRYDLQLLAGTAVAWWFGICDFLYYQILNKKIWDAKDMYWLWWTPYGIINSIFKKKTTGKQLVIFSIIGTIIGFIIAIY